MSTLLKTATINNSSTDNSESISKSCKDDSIDCANDTIDNVNKEKKDGKYEIELLPQQ